MANTDVKIVKGASRRQCVGTAEGKERKKVRDDCVAVRARKSDVDVTGRGFSPSAWTWHESAAGGCPVCSVCKRVGHVARSCWRRKTSVSDRRSGCGEDDAGIVLHSVVKNRGYDPAVDRYVKVSVNAQQVEALLDFSALENAVSLKTVKDDPKLKMYDLSDDRRANSRWLHTVGMVWLPVVFGSRAEKLRCVVVDGLTEKLIIGLPGLSFLGACINFATGDLRICCHGSKVEGCTTAVKSDELHEGQALVRDAEMKCTESSPEGRNVCTKSRMSEQVKDLARKVKPCDDGVDRGKGCRVKPNQEKKVVPVSGRGRKEGKVNVVSPEQEKLSSTTIITPTTIISPDHDMMMSEGESDSDDEDADESEELKQRSTGSAKVGKPAHKSKRKKGKKKKGSRRK